MIFGLALLLLVIATYIGREREHIIHNETLIPLGNELFDFNEAADPFHAHTRWMPATRPDTKLIALSFIEILEHLYIYR